MAWMIQTLREGIMTILIVAGPIVFIAAAIGLTVGLVQTVTNIQDQTTPTALKIVGLSVLFIVAGTWMFNHLNEFTKKTIDKSFSLVNENRTKLEIPEADNNKIINNEENFIRTFSEPMALALNPKANNLNNNYLTNNNKKDYLFQQTFSEAMNNTSNNTAKNSEYLSNNLNNNNLSPDYKYLENSKPISELPSSYQGLSSYNSNYNSSEQKSQIKNIKPVLPSSMNSSINNNYNYSDNYSETKGDKLPAPKTADSANSWY